MKQLRKRLTYANVMSSIAVFLVLGGGAAIAANQLGKNTVGSKQLKKNAVTTAKIKNNAVTAAKIQNGAITGDKVNLGSLGTVPKAAHANTAGSASNATHATNATNATNAQNAQNLNGLYFAVVNANGTLARGSAGVTSDVLGGDTYRVFLPEGVNAKECFFVGSLGGNAPGFPEEGEISVNPSSVANGVYVSTFNSAGKAEAREFTVLIRC